MAQCIASVVVDGYTRIAAEWKPYVGAWKQHATFQRLRVPLTEEQECRAREHGGRIERMPLGNGTTVAMVVRCTGERRQVLTFYAEDEVYVRIGLESGDVQLQFKARALWAWGFRRLASRWLDAVTRWCRGEACGLQNARELGWRTTGVELCSDFTGLDFADVDEWHLVGFRRRSLFQREGDEHPTETANWGTRSCPISLCIYDKDEQIRAAKDGDDSVYAAAHRANGWDGEAARVRVEFRLNGRALILENEETGERIDLREPAALADEPLLARVWSILAASKRLVLRETATRKKRCKLDPRWQSVIDAGDPSVFDQSFRQTREVNCDTHAEAIKRARVGLIRNALTLAALYGQDVSLEQAIREAAGFVFGTMEPEERADWSTYIAGYLERREEFIGEEIRRRGPPAWDAWKMAKADADSS